MRGRVASTALLPPELAERQSAVAVTVREDGLRHLDAVALELVDERRSQSRGRELTHDRAIAEDIVDLELEDVLERDHVGLHPLDLGDRGHPARPVLEPLEVDNQ